MLCIGELGENNEGHLKNIKIGLHKYMHVKKKSYED